MSAHGRHHDELDAIARQSRVAKSAMAGLGGHVGDALARCRTMARGSAKILMAPLLERKPAGSRGIEIHARVLDFLIGDNPLRKVAPGTDDDVAHQSSSDTTPLAGRTRDRADRQRNRRAWHTSRARYNRN